MEEKPARTAEPTEPAAANMFAVLVPADFGDEIVEAAMNCGVAAAKAHRVLDELVRGKPIEVGVLREVMAQLVSAEAEADDLMTLSRRFRPER